MAEAKPTDYASEALLGQFIPLAKADKRTFSKWLSQRHILLLLGFTGTLFTLTVNLVTTIVFHYQYGTNTIPGDEPALFLGDCSVANRLGSVLHAVINILSTVMLMASNLCMQLLLAPTRAQIDNAHQKGRWVDIGIPTIRNFRHVGLFQKLTWLLLGLSSLPLHFLYNSAIYNTLPAWQKQAWLGTPKFLENGPCNTTATELLLQQRSSRTVFALSQPLGAGERPQMQEQMVGWDFDETEAIDSEDCARQERSLTPSYVESLSNLTALDCLTRYSRTFTNDSYLYMISSYDLLEDREIGNQSNALLSFGVISLRETTGFNTPSWRCGNTNTFDCRRPDLWERDPTLVKDWNVLMYKIDYCLSLQASLGDLCSVRYSSTLLIVVCCANLGKVIGVALTAWSAVLKAERPASGHRFPFPFKFRRKTREELPLATMGDVIESFLTHPDPERFGGCLDGKENLLDNHGQLKKKQSPGARPWKNAYKITWLRKFQATPSDSEKQLQRSRRWYQSASIGRWCWTVIPYIIVVGSGIYFLVTSLTTVAGRAGSRTYAFSMTWGAADQNALGLLNMNITRSSPTLRNSIIMFANMWHWLLSLLYIQCNSVLTCMCAEAEWQSYARKRKSLRVTTPRGLQRSTYFVSVPMRYGLAFQLAFPVLHWTLSQGVFLVVIQGFWQGSAEYEGTNNLPFLAFSFWPIFTSILIGISILSVLVTVSLKRHANIMPMGATCSAVISAACHPPAEDVEAHLFPVQWGRVPPRAKSLAKLADTENPSGSDEVDTTLAQHHVTSNPPEPQHLEITSQSGQSQSVKGHHYELVPPSASRDDQNLQGSDIDSTAEEQQQHSGREEDVPLMMQVSPSQRSMVKPPSCTTTEIRTPAQDNMRHYTFTTYAHVECATSEEKYPDLYLKHDCEYH